MGYIELVTNAVQTDRARMTTIGHTEGVQQRVDLVYPAKDGQLPEEAIFTVHGFLVESNLPPVTSSQRYVQCFGLDRMIFAYTPALRLPSNISSAKQSVRLSGLGLEAFNKSIHGLLEIQEVLSLHVPLNTMTPWSPLREKGHPVLEFGNRYFTSVKDGQDENEDDIPLDSIDPAHVLRSRVPPGARHLSDNVVLYYQMPPRRDRYSFPH